MININIQVNMLDNLKQHFINKERDIIVTYLNK